MEQSFKYQLDQAKKYATDEAYDLALDFCQKALEFESSANEKIEALTLKAELYRILSQTEESINALNQALAIETTSMIGEDSTDQAMRQITLHIKKGELLFSVHRIDAAIEAFKSAHLFLPKPGEKGVEKFVNEKASITFHLAECYRAKKNVFFWRKYLRESIEAYDSNSPEFQPVIAHLYGSLAESYEEEDFEHAILYWKKSCSLYESLAETNADFLPYLAATFNNVAVNQKRIFEHQKAVQNYSRSLELYLKLYASDPLEYKPFLAATYNSLGILFSEMFDKEEALVHYQEAHQKYQELALAYPEMFLPYLGTILHNIGVLYDDLKNYDIALDHYFDALEIRRELADNGPHSFQIDQSITAINIVTIYQTLLEQEPASDIDQKALQLIEETQAALEPIDSTHQILEGIKGDLKYFDDYFRHFPKQEMMIQKVIRDSIQMEDDISNTDQVEEKDRLLLENMQTLEKTHGQFPDHKNLKDRLFETYNLVGWNCLIHKKYVDAEQWLRKSLEIDPHSVPARINLAHSLFFQEKHDQSKTLYQEVFEEQPKAELKKSLDQDLFQFNIGGVPDSTLDVLRSLWV
jgi:tetratricopeptide (TPR) repeat protein